jgi:predicted NAD/FAD-binding protein
MAAAIWSCPRDQVAHFPALSFARFFSNHGLINIQDRPRWQTLEGGASCYVARMIEDLGESACSSRAVRAVMREQGRVRVILDANQSEYFDQVIFACHSDQTLRLFKNANPTEANMLCSVPYQSNRVLLHGDARLMPQRRAVWSSWNYRGGRSLDGERSVSVTYWMNSLQRLDTPNDYFVSLNPLCEPDPASIVAEFEYQHPVFDLASQRLAWQLAQVQGRERVWFCGAWTGYGFHEDGIRSGVEVAVRLGAHLPWEAQLQRSSALIKRGGFETEQAA